MNDQLTGFDAVEEMLRALPLRPPAKTLDEKVLNSHPKRRGLRWALWAAAGAGAAAAAVLVAAALHQPPPRPQAPAPPAERLFADPVRYEQIISDVDYGGTFEADDGTPVRAFRRMTVRKVWYVDRDSGAKMEMTIPQAEVVLVRAETY